MYAQDREKMQARTQMDGAVGISTVMAQMAQDAARQPEVRAEMERLEKAAETLLKTAEVLSDRLDCVRNQCSNGLAGDKVQGAAPEPVLCGYANAIRTQRKKVESAQAILQRAMNELEI